MADDTKGIHWDLLVIGAGPGGYVAAIRAAQLGMRVMCVERRPTLGGVCLNEGCIPSKTLLDSSRRYAEAVAGWAGVTVSGVQCDLAAMMAHKADVVDGLTRGIASLFKKYGVTQRQGEAFVLDGQRARVVLAGGGEEVVQARRILLATGGQPVEIPFLPFDGERVITSREALSLTAVPEHLVVIGGGVIGMELSTLWRRLGAQVTVVEAMPEILPGVDVTLLRHLRRLLKKQGMVIKTGSRLVAARVGSAGVVLTVEDDRGVQEELIADRVLVAVGRRADLSAAGMGGLGLAVGEDGRLQVDGDFRTSLEGLYAVGDLVPGPMLAHKAMEEATVAVERMAGHEGRVGPIPGVIYTTPEVAMVGLSEQGAKGAGLVVECGQFPFMANGRARASGEVEGVVKVVAEAGTGRIVGVHVLGAHASELVGVGLLAMVGGVGVEGLGGMVFPHPSLGEALKEAALAARKRAVHV